MPTIKIPQKNLTLSAELSSNLMDVLIANNIPVASSCLGEGICSKCAVQMAPIGHLTPLEKTTLTRNKLDLSYRLCCQVFVTEDIEVKTGYW